MPLFSKRRPKATRTPSPASSQYEDARSHLSPDPNMEGKEDTQPNDSGVDVRIPEEQEQHHPNGVQLYDNPVPQVENVEQDDKGIDNTVGNQEDDINFPPVPVFYDDTRGDFTAETLAALGSDGSHSVSGGDIKRSLSQRSGRNKLVKSNSQRSRRVNSVGSAPSPHVQQQQQQTQNPDRPGSRISQTSRRDTVNQTSGSRISAYDVVTAAPNASLGDVNGPFSMGAAMNAPDAQIEDELTAGFAERSTIAEKTLSRRQSQKIKKEEASMGRRVTKIMKNEGKAEKKSLQAAVKELSDIQRLQQSAVKEESGAHTAHTKALGALHARELALIKARSDLEKTEADIAAKLAKIQAELNKGKAKAQAAYDKAVAAVEKAKSEVKAQEDSRDARRQHAIETTEWVKEKRKEVEVLQGWMGVDDRERAARINQMTGKKV